jgi:hypothetical protein
MRYPKGDYRKHSGVICFTPIDDRHRPADCTRRIVKGAATGFAAGLLIRESADGFYLCHCDETWKPYADSWHRTLAAAQHQAEFEYQGTAKTWIAKEA